MSTDDLPKAGETRRIVRVQGNAWQHDDDHLATEVPIALEYNGISHAVLLASPCDIDDLVLGFSCTEGVLDSPEQLYELDIENTPEGLIAHARIAAEQLHRLKQRRRQLAGRTGCGLCGLENLDDVKRVLQAIPALPQKVSPTAITQAAQQMLKRQPLRTLTGATHAAAWANETGDIQAVCEDIGRHNALDKLLGKLLRKHGTLPAGFCVVSSRASFEMVQKAASLGTSTLVALAAATTLACDTAHELGVMLVGFARDGQFTIYTHPTHLAEGGRDE